MWVKICGVRDVPTALAVARLGPDAIGLNFYAGSPRHVTVPVAAETVRELPSGVTPVGVFVNATADEILKTCEECGFSTIQLHGDEPTELLRDLTSLQVIRVLRVGEDIERVLSREFDDCTRLGVRPWRWLVEARVTGAYGGSGQPAGWDALASLPWSVDWPPLILAGDSRPATWPRRSGVFSPGGWMSPVVWNRLRGRRIRDWYRPSLSVLTARLEKPARPPYDEPVTCRLLPSSTSRLMAWQPALSVETP